MTITQILQDWSFCSDPWKLNKGTAKKYESMEKLIESILKHPDFVQDYKFTKLREGMFRETEFLNPEPEREEFTEREGPHEDGENYFKIKIK